MRKILRLAALGALLAPTAGRARDYQRAAPIQDSRSAEKWAQKTLRKLSLEEKIGQMFMARGNIEFLNIASPDFLRLRDEIERYHLGAVLVSVEAEGPFLFRNQPYEAATFTNQLQQVARVPLLFAADFERGLAMRLEGVTEFPAAMAFGATGDPAYAAGFGQITAEESRAIGVQWNLYPIADVNSNPENPIINTRSFGEAGPPPATEPGMAKAGGGFTDEPRRNEPRSDEPTAGGQSTVAEMVTAYIRAARDSGLLTTAKHFPGHGDTSTDSHLGLAEVTGNLQHLQSIELPPFQAAIDAGVDAVLVAHVTVPALDPDPNHVASLSPAVIQGLLRKKMGFKGLVIPDAMDMGGLMRLFGGAGGSGRAAVAAVQAGEDMIVMPADLDAAYNGLLRAVRSGEISEQRIDESVRKILLLKAEAGLDKARLVDLSALPELIATPEHVAFGQLISDSAVTLVRDNGRVLPLKATAPPAATGTAATANPYIAAAAAAPGKDTLAVIFSEDVRTSAGRIFERELKARIPDADVIYVDNRIAQALAPQVMAAVGQAKAVLAAIFLVPVSGKRVAVDGKLENSVAMNGGSAGLLDAILRAAAEKTAVVALGTPYIAASYPEVQNYLCTFSGTGTSERSAVKALFGEIAIRGHLPVTIPGIATRGEGITKAASATARSSLFPPAPDSAAPVPSSRVTAGGEKQNAKTKIN